MRTLLQKGSDAGLSADLPNQEQGGNTRIHIAAYDKRPDELDRLLNSLKDDPKRLKKALESTNDNGITPLFEAIWVGRPPYDFARTNPSADEMIEFKKNFYRRLKDMPATVEVLLQYGANPNSEQRGFPGGKKNGPSYTVKEWLVEQLRWQREIPIEKDPEVKKALERSLQLIDPIKLNLLNCKQGQNS